MPFFQNPWLRLATWVTLNWDNYLLWNFHLGKFVLQLLSFSLQVFETWKDPQAFLLTFQEYCNSNLTVMTSPLRLRILCQCRKLKDGYFSYFYSEMFYVAKGGMTRWKIIFLLNFVVLQWFSLFIFFISFVSFGEGSKHISSFHIVSFSVALLLPFLFGHSP